MTSAEKVGLELRSGKDWGTEGGTGLFTVDYFDTRGGGLRGGAFPSRLECDGFVRPSRVTMITGDRFLKCTDYEFECSEIVGRKFESIDDHAGYLRAGGCSEIIGVLASV